MSIAGIALQAVTLFNLVCTGTLTSDSKNLPGSTVVRVDLESRRFCFDPCHNILPIQSVTDDEIVFHKKAGLGPDGRPFEHVARFNRKTGAYTSRVAFGAGHVMVESYQCEQAPFGGFSGPFTPR